MKIARIYIPTKTAMQSGNKNNNRWVLEYPGISNSKDYLMNWNSTGNTKKQVKIFFKSKNEAINYANRNKIEFRLIEPKSRRMVIKSDADNFK